MHLKEIDIKYFKGIEHVKVHDCGKINAFLGKNNAGKSTILQAIDIAGLATSVRNWNAFQPKLEIKDLFSQAGEFEIDIKYEDDSVVNIKNNQNAPTFTPEPNDLQKFKSIFIQPDSGYALAIRRHRTPKDVMTYLENRNYSDINALDIMYAIKFYAQRRELGLTMDKYEELIKEIQKYFPDITKIDSSRTEGDISTLSYEEYGQEIDILYAGTGLKHFIDILIKITLSEAKIVLIDEPEMGLHPDLQRQYMSYLKELSERENIQFFLSTHSPVILNYAEFIKFYRIINTKGKREVLAVDGNSIHTVLGDLGIRPSDLFNSDICLLVEGQSEVIFFEHIIRTLYKKEFSKTAIAIIQYGGGAVEAIFKGGISLSNIVPAQKYTLWTHDSDTAWGVAPSGKAIKFKKIVKKSNLKCHIFKKREIEYYYPENVLIAAQAGSTSNEKKIKRILHGPQDKKFTTAAKGLSVPSGNTLKKLLTSHLTKKNQLDSEILSLMRRILIPWKKEILGE